MWACPRCREEVEADFEVCWNCGTGKDGSEDPSFRRADNDEDICEAMAPAEVEERVTTHPAHQRPIRRDPQVIVTTTPSVEGRRIGRYCGLVAGEAILGANVFLNAFPGATNDLGRCSTTDERELRRARDSALESLKRAALELSANAVVGVALNYATVGQSNPVLIVSISGTAVVLE